MKKLYIAMASATVLLASCNMDLAPIGSLDDQSAVETVNDCVRFQAGFGGNVRSISLGGLVGYPEFQGDNFQAVRALYGNNQGLLFSGNIVSSNEDIEGQWSALYSYIGNANYFIPKASALIDDTEKFSDSEILTIRRSRGVAYFTRALCYFYLLERFCPQYTDGNAQQEGLGAPIVTEFDPTYERGKYPARSSMAATVSLIREDLAAASADLAAYEVSNPSVLAAGAAYANTDICKALEARLALLINDKATAAAKAKELINCGRYELANAEQYPTVWLNDNPCKEVLYMPVVNKAEAAGVGAYGTNWTSADRQKAYYVPTQATLANYEAGDVRFTSFFEQNDIVIGGGNYELYCFVKYPGNPALTSGTVSGVNAPKAFRISEMYLILAEAGTNAEGNAALQALREARIPGYTGSTYSDALLLTEVQKERNRELIGEGFRLTDLRRWGLGFTRDNTTTAPYFPANFNEQFTADQSLSYPAGDYRMTWPIPSSEIDVNPQLKGQQNIGY
ncbi:MAG: RagB/SusD family nutrient uptake outer membrane protein [Muribaculaceae bacterium]|nr:RagB/SusD family nutrient uptake outer membrane protein [Muribaculaceae bacterium]